MCGGSRPTWPISEVNGWKWGFKPECTEEKSADSGEAEVTPSRAGRVPDLSPSPSHSQ
jgi:hypothetical protein